MFALAACDERGCCSDFLMMKLCRCLFIVLAIVWLVSTVNHSCARYFQSFNDAQYANKDYKVRRVRTAVLTSAML